MAASGHSFLSAASRLCCLAALAAAAPTTIFVAPGGDDFAGDGSIGAPFATPARGQRAARVASGAGDVTVYLRGGLYALSETLALTPEDSGANGHRVAYSAYPGDAAPPVLHGALPVSGWAQVDAARNLWSAPLPAGAGSARQAYINGRRMTPTNSATGKWDGWAITETGYVTSSAADCPTGWDDPLQNAADIELRYTGSGSSWTECRVRVASIEALASGACNITMAQPGFALARGKPYGQGVQHPMSLQNLASLLGAATPGSSYANSRTRTLYYVPLPGEDLATAFTVVPGPVEVLLSMQGDASGDEAVPVAGVDLVNLTFAYAGWDEPSLPGGPSYVDVQSAFRVMPGTADPSNDDLWLPVPGNVQLHTVRDVSVRGCTFTHLGMTALQVDDGSSLVAVTNNTFTDVSCGAVYFGQVTDMNVSATRENRDFTVSENYIVNVPAEFYDCSAILGGFLVNATIAQNTIINNSNTGISLGWGWSRDEARNAADNSIVGNYVFGSNWLLVDGGSIYVLGPQPGSVMGSNFISHQHQLYGALYTDEGSAYWYISNNVVHDVPEVLQLLRALAASPPLALARRAFALTAPSPFLPSPSHSLPPQWLHIWTPSIHDELVELNWSDQTYQDVHGTNTTVRNNVFIAPGTPLTQWPAAAQSVMSAAGVAWLAGPKD